MERKSTPAWKSLGVVLLLIASIQPGFASELDSPEALASSLGRALRENDLGSVDQLLASPASGQALRNVLTQRLKSMDRATLVVHAIPASDEQAVARATSEMAKRGLAFASLKERVDRDTRLLALTQGAYPVEPIGDLLILDASRAFLLYYGESDGQYLITLPERKKAHEASLMDRTGIRTVIADLASEDSVRQQAAVNILEGLERGYFEEHPLYAEDVAPHIPRLADLLVSSVPAVIKKWCAQVIAESRIQSPQILDSLIGALQSNDDEVLMSTIAAIGSYGKDGVAALDAVVGHIANRNRDVRWRAVWAIERMQPVGQQYAELFANLFDDDDYLVRGYAVLGFIAAATPTPWAMAKLRHAAQDRDEMPRLHALAALEQWEDNDMDQPTSVDIAAHLHPWQCFGARCRD